MNISKETKYKKQDEFWSGIIQKYEERNANLEKELLDLQERVDQMEVSMPAVMAYNMTKLAKNTPNANVNDLIQIPCDNTGAVKENKPLQLPDMSKISVFSIEDPDVHYMDVIKELTEKEKKLIDEVNKLRSKENALKKTKKKVDEIVSSPTSPQKQTTDGVDAKSLQNMNERLLEENRRLADELADLKLELKHTRENVEGPMSRELDRERRKTLKLEGELKELAFNNKNNNADTEREVKFLTAQVQAAEKTLKDLSNINSKLKDETDLLNLKIKELQNDLINQKLSEANTIATLKAGIDKSKKNDQSGPGGFDDNQKPKPPYPGNPPASGEDNQKQYPSYPSDNQKQQPLYPSDNQKQQPSYTSDNQKQQPSYPSDNQKQQPSYPSDNQKPQPLLPDTTPALNSASSKSKEKKPDETMSTSTEEYITVPLDDREKITSIINYADKLDQPSSPGDGNQPSGSGRKKESEKDAKRKPGDPGKDGVTRGTSSKKSSLGSAGDFIKDSLDKIKKKDPTLYELIRDLSREVGIRKAEKEIPTDFVETIEEVKELCDLIEQHSPQKYDSGEVLIPEKDVETSSFSGAEPDTRGKKAKEKPYTDKEFSDQIDKKESPKESPKDEKSVDKKPRSRSQIESSSTKVNNISQTEIELQKLVRQSVESSNKISSLKGDEAVTPEAEVSHTQIVMDPEVGLSTPPSKSRSKVSCPTIIEPSVMPEDKNISDQDEPVSDKNIEPRSLAGEVTALKPASMEKNLTDQPPEDTPIDLADKDAQEISEKTLPDKISETTPTTPEVVKSLSKEIRVSKESKTSTKRSSITPSSPKKPSKDLVGEEVLSSSTKLEHSKELLPKEIKQTIPENIVKPESDLDIPEGTLKSDLDQKIPEDKSKSDWDQKITEDETKPDLDQEIPEDKSKSDLDQKTLEDKTKSDLDQKSPEDKSKSDLDQKTLEDKTKSDLDQKTPEDKTKSDLDQKILGDKTKSDLDKKISEEETKSDLDKKIPEDKSQSDLDQIIYEDKTISDLDKTIPEDKLKTDLGEKISEDKLKPELQQRIPESKLKSESDEKISKSIIRSDVSPKTYVSKRKSESEEALYGSKPVTTPSEFTETIEVITELETIEDLDVDTEIKITKTSSDGVNVTTTVTRSGVIEITTEGPSGIIETTLAVTPSGNIEVITEFSENPTGETINDNESDSYNTKNYPKNINDDGGKSYKQGSSKNEEKSEENERSSKNKSTESTYEEQTEKEAVLYPNITKNEGNNVTDNFQPEVVNEPIISQKYQEKVPEAIEDFTDSFGLKSPPVSSTKASILSSKHSEEPEILKEESKFSSIYDTQYESASEKKTATVIGEEESTVGEVYDFDADTEALLNQTESISTVGSGKERVLSTSKVNEIPSIDSSIDKLVEVPEKVFSKSLLSKEMFALLVEEIVSKVASKISSFKTLENISKTPSSETPDHVLESKEEPKDISDKNSISEDSLQKSETEVLDNEDLENKSNSEDIENIPTEDAYQDEDILGEDIPMKDESSDSVVHKDEILTEKDDIKSDISKRSSSLELDDTSNPLELRDQDKSSDENSSLSFIKSILGNLEPLILKVILSKEKPDFPKLSKEFIDRISELHITEPEREEVLKANEAVISSSKSDQGDTVNLDDEEKTFNEKETSIKSPSKTSIKQADSQISDTREQTLSESLENDTTKEILPESQDGFGNILEKLMENELFNKKIKDIFGENEKLKEIYAEIKNIKEKVASNLCKCEGTDKTQSILSSSIITYESSSENNSSRKSTDCNCSANFSRKKPRTKPRVQISKTNSDDMNEKLEKILKDELDTYPCNYEHDCGCIEILKELLKYRDENKKPKRNKNSRAKKYPNRSNNETDKKTPGDYIDDFIEELENDYKHLKEKKTTSKAKLGAIIEPYCMCEMKLPLGEKIPKVSAVTETSCMCELKSPSGRPIQCKELSLEKEGGKDRSKHSISTQISKITNLSKEKSTSHDLDPQTEAAEETSKYLSAEKIKQLVTDAVKKSNTSVISALESATKLFKTSLNQVSKNITSEGSIQEEDESEDIFATPEGSDVEDNLENENVPSSDTQEKSSIPEDANKTSSSTVSKYSSTTTSQNVTDKSSNNVLDENNSLNELPKIISETSSISKDTFSKKDKKKSSASISKSSARSETTARESPSEKTQDQDTRSETLQDAEKLSTSDDISTASKDVEEDLPIPSKKLSDIKEELPEDMQKESSVKTPQSVTSSSKQSTSSKSESSNTDKNVDNKTTELIPTKHSPTKKTTPTGSKETTYSQTEELREKTIDNEFITTPKESLVKTPQSVGSSSMKSTHSKPESTHTDKNVDNKTTELIPTKHSPTKKPTPTGSKEANIGNEIITTPKESLVKTPQHFASPLKQSTHSKPESTHMDKNMDNKTRELIPTEQPTTKETTPTGSRQGSAKGTDSRKTQKTSIIRSPIGSPSKQSTHSKAQSVHQDKSMGKRTSKQISTEKIAPTVSSENINQVDKEKDVGKKTSPSKIPKVVTSLPKESSHDKSQNLEEVDESRKTPQEMSTTKEPSITATLTNKPSTKESQKVVKTSSRSEIVYMDEVVSSKESSRSKPISVEEKPLKETQKTHEPEKSIPKESSRSEPISMVERPLKETQKSPESEKSVPKESSRSGPVSMEERSLKKTQKTVESDKSTPKESSRLEPVPVKETPKTFDPEICLCIKSFNQEPVAMEEKSSKEKQKILRPENIVAERSSPTDQVSKEIDKTHEPEKSSDKKSSLLDQLLLEDRHSKEIQKTLEPEQSINTETSSKQISHKSSTKQKSVLTLETEHPENCTCIDCIVKTDFEDEISLTDELDLCNCDNKKDDQDAFLMQEVCKRIKSMKNTQNKQGEEILHAIRDEPNTLNTIEVPFDIDGNFPESKVLFDDLKEGKTLAGISDSLPKNVSKGDSKIVSERDETYKEIMELQKVIKKIKCSCRIAESVSGDAFLKQGTSYKPTVSSLQAALNIFSEKSRVKDQLIDALRKELSNAQNVGFTKKFTEHVIDDDFDVDEISKDFNRATFLESVPKSSYKNLEIFGKYPYVCKCEDELATKEDKCECVVDPSPLKILDVRRIGPTSLLIKWLPSVNKQIYGYEICVNDIIKTRAFSSSRNSAILDGLKLDTTQNIALYAVSPSGRAYPAAKAEYRIKTV